jgi:hypothetical protein
VLPPVPLPAARDDSAWLCGVTLLMMTSMYIVGSIILSLSDY